jgi:hypothetical protein
VQEPIQLAQAVVVELLNSMISALLQKSNNHKNQKLLIMIIVQMIQKIKRNQTINVH